MLRRLPSEKYHPDCIVERTRAGSGSTGLWACMSGYGFGLFQLFNGRLNQHSYIEILEKNLVASKKKLKMPNSFIFQQDNAPCHRAKSVANWMKRRKVKTLQWPPNSPDLNPIENLWSWLDGKLAKEELNTLQDLTVAINQILSNVPDHLIKNLVESMPNRIHECLKAHGGITRY